MNADFGQATIDLKDERFCEMLRDYAPQDAINNEEFEPC